MRQELIEEELRKSGTRFVFIVGYDGLLPFIPHDMVDLMYQRSNSIPDMDYIAFVMSFYKPLEVRGKFRGLIWVECYDATGQLDLPKVVKTGKVTYTRLFNTV